MQSGQLNRIYYSPENRLSVFGTVWCKNRCYLSITTKFVNESLQLAIDQYLNYTEGYLIWSCSCSIIIVKKSISPSKWGLLIRYSFSKIAPIDSLSPDPSEFATILVHIHSHLSKFEDDAICINPFYLRNKISHCISLLQKIILVHTDHFDQPFALVINILYTLYRWMVAETTNGNKK